MPAACARFALASLRPASEVSTFTLCSVRRWPTPLPMLPGAMMATVGVMLCLPRSNYLTAIPRYYFVR